MKASKQTFLYYEFDQSKADRAIRFIETCCVFSKGKFAGRPFKLRPWQRTIIEQLFGWHDPVTGLRRYRKAFIFLPRKNGKSHLAAAIALYCLFGDGEQGAEVIFAANSRDQASICYQAASGMVRQSPVLAGISKCIPSTKRIEVHSTNSILKTISADAGTNLGLDVSACVVDEICFAPNRDLWDALTTATGSRLQPLIVAISTAGWDIDGVGYELYEYAKEVLKDPALDPTFYPCIFEVPADADWTNEKTWAAANPALGDFLQLETLRQACKEAINKPTDAPKFRMFHANQWVQAAESWLDRNKWDALKVENFDTSKLKDCNLYLGNDLSSNQDLSCVSALWVAADGTHYFKPFLFLPGEGLRERELKDHVPYSAWVEQGHIYLTPGPTIDYGFIKKKIEDLAAAYDVKAIGYDPWQAHKLIDDLTTQGLNCVQIRQGHQSLAAPTKEFETLIVSGRIKHDGNACMSWMIGNATLRLDANGNGVVSKRKTKQRIDGVAASIMAVACAMKLQAEPPPKKKPAFKVHIFG